MPVVGWLGSESREAEDLRIVPFRQGLKEAGYVEGQNLAIEYRVAEGQSDRLPALAADLVQRKVNVIFTSGLHLSAQAAKAEGTLTVYSSMNEQEGLPLWKKFEDATGIKTEYVRSNDNALITRTALERRAQATN